MLSTQPPSTKNTSYIQGVEPKTGLQIFREFAQVLSHYALADTQVALDIIDKRYLKLAALQRIGRAQKAYQEGLTRIGDDPREEFLVCSAFISEFLRDRYQAVVHEMDQTAGSECVGVISTPIFAPTGLDRQPEIYEYNEGKNTMPSTIMRLPALQAHLAKFYTELQQYMATESPQSEELAREIRSWITKHIGPAATIQQHLIASNAIAINRLEARVNPPNANEARSINYCLLFGLAFTGGTLYGLVESVEKEQAGKDSSYYIGQFAFYFGFGALCLLSCVAAKCSQRRNAQQAVAQVNAPYYQALREPAQPQPEGQPLLAVSGSSSRSSSYGSINNV